MTIVSNISLRIEDKIVSIERGLLIDHLDYRGKELSLIHITIIGSPIGIGVCGVLVDNDITITLNALIAIPHSTVGRNYRTIMLGGEIAHKAVYIERITHLIGVYHIGCNINHPLLCISGLVTLLCHSTRTATQHPKER